LKYKDLAVGIKILIQFKNKNKLSIGVKVIQYTFLSLLMQSKHQYYGLAWAVSGKLGVAVFKDGWLGHDCN
jgi:hypothetical protein